MLEQVVEQESVAGIYGNAKVVLSRWQENPYALISWWDMEQFSAEAFYTIGIVMEQTRELARLPSLDEEDRIQRLQNRDVTLESIASMVQRIGLRQSEKQVRRIQKTLQTGDIGSAEFAQRLTELDNRICDEMEDHLFMHIPPSRAERYEVEDGFGATVSLK